MSDTTAAGMYRRTLVSPPWISWYLAGLAISFGVYVSSGLGAASITFGGYLALTSLGFAMLWMDEQEVSD